MPKKPQQKNGAVRSALIRPNGRLAARVLKVAAKLQADEGSGSLAGWVVELASESPRFAGLVEEMEGPTIRDTLSESIRK